MKSSIKKNAFYAITFLVLVAYGPGVIALNSLLVKKNILNGSKTDFLALALFCALIFSLLFFYFEKKLKIFNASK